jgi:hypothetical protein
MSPEEYAEHRGAELTENPQRRSTMAKSTSKADLEAELNDANDYIEQLEGKLNDIVGIAADDDEDEDSGNESDDDEGNDDSD